MPRKKAPLAGPNHFNVIYKPPSHSTNNNKANQKQIQQHIPTHTTEKHQLFRQKNNSLPWPPIHLSQPWMPQKAEKFLCIPWRSTRGGLPDWGGTELQGYGTLGKKLCQQLPLFSGEIYPLSQPLQLRQHYVGKGSLTGVGGSQVI